MQTLFEIDFRGAEADDPTVILPRTIQEIGQANVDASFAEALLLGIQEKKEDVQQAMSENAPQWPLERMDRMTRAILMIGAYELLFAGDAPAAVVMNEAIELAKEFGDGESGKFVNGVLNAIAHE
jgi:N utilization substance protein B